MRGALAGVRSIAHAGYLFLLPLVVHYRQLYSEAVDVSSPSFGGGFDRWIRRRNATSLLTEVSSSHLTSLESTAWLDLRTEAAVLRVSARDRAASVRISDLWGFVIEEVEVAAEASYAVLVMPAGPVQAVPDDVSNTVVAETFICRGSVSVRLKDKFDPDRAQAIEDSFHIEPLTTWSCRQPDAGPPSGAWWPADESVLTTDEFWSVAAFALALTEPHDDDRGLLARLAELGMSPGARWRSTDIAPDVLSAMRDGMDEALTELMRSGSNDADPTPTGTRARSDRDYFARAVAALCAMSLTSPAMT